MSSDDGFQTQSSEEQLAIEKEVLKLYGQVIHSPDFEPEVSFALNRDAHVKFLQKGLSEPLRASFISLEASRPWIVYWILHGLDLLNQRDLILREFSISIPQFLGKCQSQTGGFGGGPGQIAHLATTYASVSALVCIGTETALSIIDRSAMKNFLIRMKDPVSGGFHMHDDGEIDIRGTYCAIAVASILEILDDELINGVDSYVASCQTYEGGIAGEPGMEAHGGYTYCGLAAVAIIGRVNESLNTKSLLQWLCRRQMPMEGGFNGRANKLVDSCYTFWQGASLSILQQLIPQNSLLFSPEPAQMYVLLACQLSTGGLRDKPGKNPDYYHSCYSLSGLAALQRPLGLKNVTNIVGPSTNLLEPNCCLYNNTIRRVEYARKFIKNLPIMGSEGTGIFSIYS